jgi:hypothetical protein
MKKSKNEKTKKIRKITNRHVINAKKIEKTKK